jgi:hypothetical protein
MRWITWCLNHLQSWLHFGFAQTSSLNLRLQEGHLALEWKRHSPRHVSSKGNWCSEVTTQRPSTPIEYMLWPHWIHWTSKGRSSSWITKENGILWASFRLCLLHLVEKRQTTKNQRSLVVDNVELEINNQWTTLFKRDAAWSNGFFISYRNRWILCHQPITRGVDSALMDVFLNMSNIDLKNSYLACWRMKARDTKTDNVA